MLERYGSGVRACQAHLLPAQEGDELEVDEMWTWYGNKDQVIWLWIALCRRTRQVVAWCWGDHGQEWAQWLWNKVPQDYKDGPVYADAWGAYQGAIPPNQLHQQAKKGPTNHLERFNCTLRQRLARLVRKTLSFSKSFYMHLVCLRRFFCRYNQEQAQKYLASHPR